MTIVDDYAHHPDEITATLDSAKHFPHNRTWCVFQPHTYTRTKALLPELGKECYYFHSFEEIEKFLLKNCINGDLLITMGAGDVYKVGEALVNQ